jgi:hypothetical protein
MNFLTNFILIVPGLFSWCSIGLECLKFCISMHRHIMQLNHPTRCKFFSSFLLYVYVQLNMFRASSPLSSGAEQQQWQHLVLPLGRGGSSLVGRGRAGCGKSWISHNRPDHDQQHCYHHAPTVKPDAATAVVELLMMVVRTPETSCALHKRQAIILRNVFI